MLNATQCASRRHEYVERVLRYDLTATDGSGRLLVQYALPGRDFETAEALETNGLIEREFTAGEWTITGPRAGRHARRNLAVQRQ